MLENNNDFWQSVQGWFSESDSASYANVVSQYTTGAKLAEIGVWKGRSLLSVLPLAKRLNYSEIVAIDTFKGSDSELSTSHIDATTMDLKEVFENNLKSAGYLDIVTVIQSDSITASQKFSDEYFDVIFIDADHSADSVRKDISCWLPKLKKGGTMIGHDWVWESVRTTVLDLLNGSNGVENMWWYTK